jgi:hypothetical protein
VDLGASLGPFSIAAAVLGARVVAVDINKESLAKLKQQAAWNRCLEKITVILSAVGPQTGMCTEEIKQVPALRFDALLEQNAISSVDFLKIDIEGSEFDLLTHDNEWLRSVRKIAMEVHPEYGDPKGLEEILVSFGFEVFMKDLDGRVVPTVTDIAGGYLFAKRT